MVEKFPIDFVVSWVDGSDLEWLKKYNKYSADDHLDAKQARFRDYDIFNYWFRAVEKFTPWVNHIYLVTDNQKPAWLNEKNEKITIVDHTEIIDNKYLPVFNSSAIELNLYKIPGLSENFVYFNDDMFVNAPMKPSDFFDKKGLPKDTAGLNAIQPNVDFDYIHVNNMRIINKKFNKKDVMKKNFFKFFNIKNGPLNIYTTLLFFWPQFTRFFDLHYPYSLVKSQMKDFIEENGSSYKDTMNDKFRGKNDITIWSVRYSMLAKGYFSVRSYRIGKIFDLYTKSDQAIADIKKSKHKMIVLNDSEKMSDNQINLVKLQLKKSFENKLPDISSFESKH